MKKTLLMILVLLMALPTLAQGLKPQKDEKKNLWGYVDGAGKWVVKPKFDEASEFKMQPNGKQRAVVKSKGLQGFVDETGKALGVGIVFEEIETLEGADVVGVTVKGKTGVANYDGVYVVKPEYDGVQMCLDGAAYIGRVKDKFKFDIISGKTGKRKISFDGLTGINVNEFPDKGAMLLFLSNGKNYIYTKDIDEVNKIGVRLDGVGDFYRTFLSFKKDAYYTNDDKKSMEPYLQSDGHFLSSDGKKTKYLFGNTINTTLYYMSETDNGPVDVFKFSESEPIGTMEKKPEGYNVEIFKLNGDKYINAVGDPVEVIFDPTQTHDGKMYYPLAYKNIRTGKYGIIVNGVTKQFGIEKTNNYNLKDPSEYEVFDFVDVSKTYGKYAGEYGWLILKDGTLYHLNSQGVTKTTDSSIDIQKLKDGYTKFVDLNGKFGLKYNNEVILPNEYTGIYELHTYDGRESYYTDYLKLYKDGKCALYNIKTKQIVIPFEKGYTTVGGTARSLNVRQEMYDSGLVYAQVGEDNDPDKALGLWSLTAGKELIAPAKGNSIGYLPKGYKGYTYNGVAYTPEGKVLKLAPAVDVYQSDWANDAPYYYVKLAGLKGRTIKFQLTVYNENGTVYTGRDGNKCIYTFSQTVTPETEVEYGPEITFYLGNDIYIPKHTKRTLNFVLSAKDAKTGAAIPVKGEKSYGRWFQRGGL